jgi:hypothetical protein
MKRIMACAALACILAACAFNRASANLNSNSTADDPATVAQRLFRAYNNCNRAAALMVASPAAVNKLFGRRCRPGGGSNMSFQGCERHGRGYLCNYYYEGGAMNMTVVRRRGNYRVISVGYIAD